MRIVLVTPNGRATVHLQFAHTIAHPGRIMTLLHFINCVGAAYAPYFISYRYSGL